MATMIDIEGAAKKFSAARASLADEVAAMQAALNEVRLKYLPSLKAAVASAKAEHATTAALVAESPELFRRPRSVVLHGVKLGYGKAKGRVEIADEEKTVRLIKKHHADKADVLIKTTETPVKKALCNLTADELKKLAVEVTADGDVVFVVDTAAEVDKLVAAFLKDETEQAVEEREALAA